jgi:hypothetical protein
VPAIRKNVDVRAALVLVAVVATPALAAPPLAVPLALEESAGVARHTWPASASVPLPRGRVPSADALWLAAPDGRAAPAQLRALERWPDGSVRWLLVDFLADVPSGGRATYTLRDGKPPKPAGGPRMRIESAADGGRRIDTGVLATTVPAHGTALLEDVAVGGRHVKAVALPALTIDGAPAGAPARERVSVETDGPRPDRAAPHRALSAGRRLGAARRGVRGAAPRAPPPHRHERRRSPLCRGALAAARRPRSL